MGEEFKELILQVVDLEPEAWAVFEKTLRFQRYKRKELVLREGEVCRHLFFIKKGYVRLYYLIDGTEITKDFNFENDICGSYASFKTQLPSRFSVVAMEELEVYLIERDSLFALMEKYPGMQKFARISIEKMFIRKEMRESAFLVDSVEKRYNDLFDERPQITRRVPLKYIASYLGVTAETVSRIRKQIK